MAHFLGSVKGSRGETTRLGHKSSGLTCRAAGWDVGVSLHAHNDGNGVDNIGIFADEGNGYNAGRSFSIGTVRESEHGPMFLPSQYVRELCRAADAAEADGQGVTAVEVSA